MPKDFVVPVRRTAPGEVEAGKHELCVLPWSPSQEGERTFPQPPGSNGRGQRWGECQGKRGLVPEISAADVSEPGAAQATRLHEVLGSEHHGPHP